MVRDVVIQEFILNAVGEQSEVDFKQRSNTD